MPRELERIGIDRWTEEVQKLDEEDLAIKIEAIATYASQVDRLFQGGDPMAERVRGYALALSSEEGYGETYWGLSYDVKSAMQKEPR